MRPKVLRALLLSGVWLTFIICQRFWPVLSVGFFDPIAESIYALSKTSYFSAAQDGKSRIAIIEIGSETRKELGWPIPRENFVALLEGLKENGHPVVLSNLWISDLRGETESTRNLENAIRAYQKYVGSGIHLVSGEEPSEEQIVEVLSRVILTNQGEMPYISRLEMIFEESSSMMLSQRAYGSGQVFGNEPVVYCMKMLFGHNQGELVIPSAPLWAAALLAEKNPRTYHGASPLVGNNEAGSILFHDKHCLDHTDVNTAEYFEKAQIEVFEMIDLLDFEESLQKSFEDMLVILSVADTPKKFIGPGVSGKVVRQHRIVARFLDTLLRKQDVVRSSKTESRIWPEILTFFVLLGCSLLMVRGKTLVCIAVLSAAILLLFVSMGYAILGLREFWVPVSLFFILGISLQLFGVWFVYQKLRSIVVPFKVSQSLKMQLPAADSLEKLKTIIEGVCTSFDLPVQVELTNGHRHLFAAASAPEQFAKLKGTLNSQPKVEVKDEVKVEKGCYLKVKLARTRGVALGKLSYQAQLIPENVELVPTVIESIENDILSQWYKVYVQQIQRVQSFEILQAQTRANILGKFLPDSLVKRFHGNSLSKSLNSVLRPTAKECAILQADIRGFSKLAKELSSMELITSLQDYFNSVVDEAQSIAQVKLIGDCIFLFIEHDVGTERYSACDLALNIAMQLVDSVINHPRKFKTVTVEFGIAIHYGECICGNLSSESCIDYTVIGNNVNKTARLEELTKHERVKNLVGSNAILLTDPVKSRLNMYNDTSADHLDIEKLDIKVRSFESEEIKIYYLKSSESEKQLKEKERLKSWVVR